MSAPKHDPMQRATRLAWVALAFASLSVALALIGRVVGGSIPWTSWVGPLLVAANAAAFLLPQTRRHPRAMTAYYSVTAAIGLIIIFAIARQLWHRGAAI